MGTTNFSHSWLDLWEVVVVGGQERSEFRIWKLRALRTDLLLTQASLRLVWGLSFPMSSEVWAKTSAFHLF